MSHHPMLPALAHKLAEIDGELRRLTQQADRLRTERAAVETVTRLFDPSHRPPPSERPAQQPRLFPHGDLTRAVLGMLREAEAPMTVAEITTRLESEQGFVVPPGGETLKDKVRSTLQRHAGKALVRGMNGPEVTWCVAREAQ